MDLSNFNSKKLLLTVAAVILVTVADQLGMPLDAETLDFIQNVLMTFLGAQGSVDIAKVIKTGTTFSKGVTAAKELADASASDEEVAEAGTEPPGA
jgi:hypothetical protein